MKDGCENNNLIKATKELKQMMIASSEAEPVLHCLHEKP